TFWRYAPVEPTRLLTRLIIGKQKTRRKAGFFIVGGEGGIRTLDTLLTYTHFPGVLLQPLGHLSKTWETQFMQTLWESHGRARYSGFALTPLGPPSFLRRFLWLGSLRINHSDISPKPRILFRFALLKRAVRTRPTLYTITP